MKAVVDRIVGAGGRLFSVLGIVAGIFVELAPYLDLLPKGSKVHYYAAGLVGFGLWYQRRPKSDPAVLTPKPPVSPAVLVLIVGSFMFAAPAFGQEAGGVLPQAGTCSASGKACLQPVLTVLPIVIDARSGNVSKDVAFGFGYGLVFPKSPLLGLVPGVDLLGGTKTSGGWIAAALPKLGALRLGPVLTHSPGATYLGVGFGVGTP